MGKFIGRLADIGITKEAVRGTAETTATFWLPKLSLTMDDGIEQAVDESSIGVIEDSPNASVVGKFATGEIEGIIGDDSFGLILLSALGGVSTGSATQSTVYPHTFSVSQSAQHQSLTLFLDDGNQDYKYPLAVLDSLQIDAMVREYAKFTASFRSKKGTTATLAPSYSTENNFLPQHITLAYASSLAGLSSPTSVNVRSVKLNINKNIEDDRNLGSLDQTDILNKQISVEGSVELVFDAEIFKTQMLANTPLAVRLELTNSDVTIGSSLNPKITIDMAKVKFSEFTKNYENNEIVVATVNFKAFYSVADTAMISVVLTNETSGY
ncbi:MAG: phage tail tube protein [Bauldia litoralis]|uniref:phage tail tube protein n=1 Tax=Bauldia litoralis TaxID=665467 RepID=UPI003296B50D